jgi:uncharacterized phage protein (TIGR02218 family)
MKTASVNLINLLNAVRAGTRNLYMCNLYIFQLVGAGVQSLDGPTIRYTDHDVDIVVDGNTYKSMTIGKGDILEKTGCDVDDCKINIFYDNTVTISGGATLFNALQSGAFDGAQVTIYRLFNPNPWVYPQTPIAVDYMLLRFIGRMDVESCKINSAELTIKSYTELLNVQVPVNLYMPNCLNTLYGPVCTLNQTSFAVSGTITSSSTNHILNTSISQATGYFDLGRMTFTSGQNSGAMRTIKTQTNGTLTMANYWGFVPQIGDAFTIYPGCDLTKSTCQTKFSNLIHFKAFPFIPQPETIT